MLTHRQWLLGGALVGAVALYIASRTSAGTAAADSVLEFVDVSASRLRNAITTHGYRNNNPGCMRANAFRGCTGVDADGIAQFDTPQNGTRALGKQLLLYAQRGLRTVRAIASTWAPPSENDTAAYIADLCAQLDVDADAPLDVHARLPQLAQAIARHENGYADDSYDWNWVYLP